MNQQQFDEYIEQIKTNQITGEELQESAAANIGLLLSLGLTNEEALKEIMPYYESFNAMPIQDRPLIDIDKRGPQTLFIYQVGITENFYIGLEDEGLTNRLAELRKITSEASKVRFCIEHKDAFELYRSITDALKGYYEGNGYFIIPDEVSDALIDSLAQKMIEIDFTNLIKTEDNGQFNG